MTKNENIISSIFGAIFIAPLLFLFLKYTYFDKLKKDNKWKKGRKFSVWFQYTLISDIIYILVIRLIIFYTYNDIDLQLGMKVTFSMICLMLIISTLMSLEYFELSTNKYLSLPLISLLVVAIGTLWEAIAQANGYIIMNYGTTIYISIAVFYLIIIEIYFLKSNRWKFIPENPK
ncbi:hypothetical protein [uncultured Desulfobulbus sp.]|uniref:hypothetical protein n=1 Tax=uncultured Desulfobulbus sp. TaxID=239745 RepID=UPI0029C8D850|nr:hypothetical protein [uncultured Desulfobulbus sp.]